MHRFDVLIMCLGTYSDMRMSSPSFNYCCLTFELLPSKDVRHDQYLVVLHTSDSWRFSSSLWTASLTSSNSDCTLFCWCQNDTVCI